MTSSANHKSSTATMERSLLGEDGGHKTAKMMEAMMANMKSPGGGGGRSQGGGGKTISVKKKGGSSGGRSP